MQVKKPLFRITALSYYNRSRMSHHEDKGAYCYDMRETRKRNLKPNIVNHNLNQTTGSERPSGAIRAEERIKRLQKKQNRLRRKALTAGLLAVVILIAAVAGSKAATDNEQAIRLALSERNYELEGAEGPQYYEAEYKDAEELREDSAEMTAEILREGTVLLKNDNDILPLRKGASVSVFGKAAADPVYSSAAQVSGAQDLRSALEAEKIRVNDKLWDFISRGGGNSFSKRVEKSFEEYSEAAIVVIARSGADTDLYEPAFAAAQEEPEEKEQEEAAESASGLGSTAVLEAPNEEEEPAAPLVTGAKALQLTEQERDLLSYVTDHFDQVIVVLNTENPMEMGFLNEFSIDGCLWTGSWGQKGVTALAEVLSGKTNPSGGLPDTYVYNSFSAPAAANLGDYTIRNSKENYGTKYMNYAEGIYIGYRYYETRYEDTVLGTTGKRGFDYAKEVAFPFGYGLSYTTFELRNMKMELGKKGYEVTVDVYNTGDREGKEVVQIYLQKPYSDYAQKNGMEVPSVELVGFAKTKVISPGEHESVKIVMSEEALKSFDAFGKGTYIIDEGTYLVTAAQDAHAAVNNILMYKGKARSELITGTGDGGLVEVIERKRDNKKFAVTAQTGAKVRPRFTEASASAYDPDFQGLTRSLWTSTWPSTWQDGSFAAASSFLGLLRVSAGEDSNAASPVYNTAHGEKNAALVELRDVEFDDYRWGSLMDQLTWRETYSLVRKGGGLVNDVMSCSSPQAWTSAYESGLAAKYNDSRGSIYPSATVLAATWNTELMGQVAQLIGEEALKAEVSFLQIPSLNLHRTAMGGRNCDSFSEDSVLTGKMAAAFCKGLSKKGVIPVLGKMVLADQETNYIGLTVLASEQAIRELYLRPFEIALREGGSGMKAVMAGMNRIGPRWCGGHIGLLTEVLRNEWGFEGFVMTDQVTSGIDSYADILEGLEAGTDMWQNTSNGRYKLKGGQLTYGVRARFRTAAERILRTVSRSNAMNGMDKDTTMKYTSPAWRLIRIVVILLSVVASLLCLLYAAKKLRSEALVRDKLAQVKRDYKRSRRG